MLEEFKLPIVHLICYKSSMLPSFFIGSLIHLERIKDFTKEYEKKAKYKQKVQI